MTRIKRFALVLAALIALGGGIGYFAGSGDPVPSGNPTAAPEGPDWQDLLGDDSARAWRNITDESEIFEIREGMLHIPGNSVYPLRYVAWGDERLGDFELHLEFKAASGANSGIFLRAQPNDPVYRGFEVQVLEDFGDPPNKNGSGAIYDVVTPMFNLARPTGEWNSYDITVRGTSVVVIMNGWKVIDTDLALMTVPLGKFSVAYADLPREGLLMLQDHGGEVWYRNIRLKRL
ncbi:MAG: DUF1080 domain-containing protein [Candidatus Hydrogenedentes bacterium]|nr:DUF1080 domain-containing protein [Candidatus Hydrogenedentota bacterium]